AKSGAAGPYSAALWGAAAVVSAANWTIGHRMEQIKKEYDRTVKTCEIENDNLANEIIGNFRKHDEQKGIIASNTKYLNQEISDFQDEIALSILKAQRDIKSFFESYLDQKVQDNEIDALISRYREQVVDILDRHNSEVHLLRKKISNLRKILADDTLILSYRRS
ncbi:MAG: hypothetical protein KAG61_07855, partial [Bacteriovoracaceae bacterium]|nr:hypothetical protein [Bacteriovoracaceae bacterium]